MIYLKSHVMPSRSYNMQHEGGFSCIAAILNPKSFVVIIISISMLPEHVIMSFDYHILGVAFEFGSIFWFSASLRPVEYLWDLAWVKHSFFPSKLVLFISITRFHNLISHQTDVF